MKISTGSTRETPRGKSGAPARRKAPVHRKAPQKTRKIRISGQRILSSIRILGKAAGIAVAGAAIFFLGSSFYRSEKFYTHDIAIYGCKEADPKMLEKIVRRYARGHLLNVEMDLLKQKIEEVNWVQSVEIRRVLPSGLVIYVRERIPSVILEIEGQLIIADEDGILLDKYTSRYGKLDVPVFKGVAGSDSDGYRAYQELNSTRIRRALDMLSEIGSQAPLYSRKISEVDITDQDNLKIMLVDDTAEIYLGNGDYLKRFQALMNSSQYQEFRKNNMNIAVVDLRFDDRIVYSRSQATTESPGKGKKE